MIAAPPSPAPRPLVRNRPDDLAPPEHPEPPRVLVATDGRAGADGAVRLGRRLAEGGMHVDYLAVFEPHIPIPMASSDPGPHRCEPCDRPEFTRLLRAVRQQLSRLGADPSASRLRVETGQAPLVIARVARELDADLIVLGLGRDEPDARRLGSETAMRVSVLCHCALLAVPATIDALPRRALVVQDFCDDSLDEVRIALNVLAHGGTLLYAGTPDDSPELREARAHEVQTVAANLRPDVAIESGKEVTSAGDICARSELAGADLIVTPIAGRTFAERTLIRGPARAVLRGSRMAVLLVPVCGLDEELGRRRSATPEVATPEAATNSRADVLTMAVV